MLSLTGRCTSFSYSARRTAPLGAAATSKSSPAAESTAPSSPASCVASRTSWWKASFASEPFLRFPASRPPRVLAFTMTSHDTGAAAEHDDVDGPLPLLPLPLLPLPLLAAAC